MELLCLAVKLKQIFRPFPEDVLRSIRQLLIPRSQKRPRLIRFVDDFPMTVTGKVQKFRMREQMIAQLGSADPQPS